MFDWTQPPWSRREGLIKCKVLPPRGIRIPVTLTARYGNFRTRRTHYCIREFSTRECATLTTTPVYRTDMRHHYIYILVAVRLESNLVCVYVWVHIDIFALPFNLLHFTCDIIYYYLPFIYFNCIYFSSHVYGCSWYLRYYK